MATVKPVRKESNRLYVAVCAVFIEMCLGAVSAGSFITAALSAPAGKNAVGNVQAQWIFLTCMALFAAGVVLSGYLLGRTGPKKLAWAGGGLLGAGFVLAGMIGTGYASILICIGILAGLGAGLGYIVPVVIGMKWYPDRRGLITGLVLSGGVLGSIIWTGLAGPWLDLFNTLSLFDLDGLRSVFLLYGVLFLVIILPAGSAMADPPLGYAQAGWSSPQASVPGSGLVYFEPGEMVRTHQFIFLFCAFFLSVAAGIVAGAEVATFGLDALKAKGLEPKISLAVAVWAAGSFLVLNGVGQAVWGSISDMIGRRISLTILCVIQGIVLLLLYRIGGDPKVLIFCACLIGFNLGGNFALFPVVTAEYFGMRNLGLNYGIVFISAGLAGLIGPTLAGHVQALVIKNVPPNAVQNTLPAALHGAWLLAFVLAGAASLVAAGLAFLAKPPRKEMNRFEAIMRSRTIIPPMDVEKIHDRETGAEEDVGQEKHVREV